MDRDQVERDLEQFAALAQTLGRHAEIELFDPQLEAAVRVSIGEPLFRRRDMTRRKRIRAAARARKSRRGWR